MSDALINPERALEYWNDQAQEEQDNNSEDNLLGWGESAWRGFNSGYQRAYGAAIRGLNVATHNDDRLYWEAITSGERTDAPAAGEDPLKEDWWEGFFAEADRDLQRAARRNDADPSTQSMAGSIIYPVTQMLTQATVGSPGGPFGSALSVAGAQGVTSYDTARSEGLNPDQAMGMALREGGFMGAMTLLPAAIGGRLLTRIGTGAGINLATGAGYRYELNRYLTEEGFPELAARYRWDDAQAAAIDAILGAAFGALPHSGRAGRAEPIPQELSDAALVAGADLRRRTQFGIPTNDASRRWAAEASARMEEQAARDEPIDPGPMPEGVDFVPLPESGAPEWDGAMRAFEEEARAQGLDDVAGRIRRLREERPDAFDGDEGALFSMRRGLGEERGRARFYDERLSPSQNKAVEMARNGYSNAEIADELDTTAATVAVTLSQAKKRAPGLEIPSSRQGSPPGRGGKTATIEDIARLYDQLSRQGYRNRPGHPLLGRRNINTIIAERLGLTSGNVAKRLSIYREEVAAGKREPLFSQAAEVQGFSTVEELQARASEILGADWGALSRAGKVEIVQSSADVPAPMGLPRGVQAVHMRDTGTSYFIANNIRPEDLYGLVLHEVGVHNGFETMLGKRGFNEVLRQIDRMIEADHPALVEARAIAERYAAREEHVPEETLAYLIETHADLPLVNSVLSKLRQWLIKTFGTTFGMRLTVDDLRALAITSLRRVAEQARREGPEPAIVSRLNPLYSNGPDAGDAGAGTFDTSRVVYRGLGRQYDPANGGYYQSFTSSLADAREYGSNVIAAHLRPGRNLAIDGGGNNFNALSVEQLPADVRARLHPSVGASASTDQIAHAAREAGYDSVTVRNVHDNRWGERPVSGAEPRTIDFVFDTRNISPLDAVPEHTAAPAAAPERVRLTDADRALLDELERDLSAPQSPNEGNAGDFPLFSQSRQNGENLVGAKRDPIESPDYQRRIAELRGELGGEDGRAGRGDASLRAGEEGKRTDLGAVVAVSGLRLQTRPKGSDFGTHRATIDTPIPTDADPILQARDGAEGKHTVVDFDFIDGNNPKEVRLPGVHIRWTRLNDAAKGKGIGVWIYRQLIDWADRQGLPVYSDFAISPEAQPIYGALARRGYNVEQINPHVKGSDGFIRNQKYQPIFRISRTGVEADYDAAPPPRDDYQIDGPTLRERQTRIDEQRARQEAYDKLNPVEQVLADDPDLPIMTDYGQPMFSRGGPQKRQYRAAHLFQDARAEAEAAREMRKGFEAAARCAARHGAGGAVRGVTGGAMYVGITGNAVMMGHALGLTAAIPIGITAAPILARSANPRRYAEGRLAAAEASLRDAEARYFREGNVRGERAGLDAPASYDTPQGEPLWDNVDTSRRAGDTAQFAAPETPWQASEAELQNPGLAPEPTTFSAPGGGTTPEGGRVPPAPPSLKPQARPTDYSQDIARLFDMPEDDQ